MSKNNIFLADEKDILSLSSLFLEVFNKAVDSKELIWRYLENPDKKSNFLSNVMLKNEDKIVGHTAVIPSNLNINNNPIRGCLSVSSMVSRSNPGSFPLLLQYMINHLREHQYDLVYAFPNPNSSPFLIKYFGFSEGFLSLLKVEANNLFIVDETDIELNLKNKVIKHSDTDYLNWRFHRFQKCLYIESDSLRIYYKSYNKNECDILSVQPRGSLKYSMREVLRLLKKLKSFKTFNYLTTDKEADSLFTSVGFTKENLKNKFVYLWLDQEKDNDNIALQMSDNDW